METSTTASYIKRLLTTGIQSNDDVHSGSDIFSLGDEEAKAKKDEPTAPKERKTTQRWSAEEDAQLAELVGSATRIKWTKLAKNMTDRTAKQCQERYTNYLKLNNRKRGQWTEEEDSNIMKLQEMFGNQWSKIAARKSFVKFEVFV